MVVAAASGKLLGDILAKVIAAEGDMELVRHEGSDEAIVATACRSGAHVVIVGEVSRRLYDVFDRLLDHRPRTRILSLTGDGQKAFLYRLRPELVELGELSPETLIAAIRDRSTPRTG